jgi:hypothetical protein
VEASGIVPYDSALVTGAVPNGDGTNGGTHGTVPRKKRKLDDFREEKAATPPFTGKEVSHMPALVHKFSSFCWGGFGFTLPALPFPVKRGAFLAPPRLCAGL